jgi:hypothetical protein
VTVRVDVAVDGGWRAEWIARLWDGVGEKRGKRWG